MGSFEKLGILVIVVIIVMILAVAVYQWGANGVEAGPNPLPVLVEEPQPLYVDYLERQKRSKERKAPDPAPAKAGEWPGGLPRTYTMKKGDIVWSLVRQEWKLSEGFIDAIRAANPGLKVETLRAGDELKIPDPAPYRKGSKKAAKKSKPATGVATREYEIKEGDSLGTIARDHLGSARRWKEIVKANPGIDPKKLKLGQKIRMPAK